VVDREPYRLMSELLPGLEREPVVSLVSELRLAEDENFDDVLVGSAYLGARRALLLDRPGGTEDMTFALSIFCWWPRKPDPPPDVQDQLYLVRREAFRGAARGEWDRLDHVVPESTLLLSPSELFEAQRRGLRAFLNV
jgi:hypothetical protein